MDASSKAKGQQLADTNSTLIIRIVFTEIEQSELYLKYLELSTDINVHISIDMIINCVPQGDMNASGQADKLTKKC